MKKQTKTTKQYDVSKSNTFKTTPDLSQTVADYLGNLYNPDKKQCDANIEYYDATRDVTDKDTAAVTYRRLIEANQERTYERRVANHSDRNSLIAFIISMAAIAGMTAYILLTYKF